MDYGDLFTRAWNLTWRHKWLYLLGFLAALGSAGGSGGSSNAGLNYTVPANTLSALPTTGDPLALFERFWTLYGPAIVAFGILALVLAIVLWLVRLTAQAGLIGAAATLDAGGQITFWQALTQGFGKLGRMIGLSVVLFGPFVLVALFAAAWFGSQFVTLIGGLLYESLDPVQLADAGRRLSVFGTAAFCLTCLLIPLLLFVNLLFPFAQRSAVLEDQGVFGSIGRGWAVIRDHLGTVLILALFLVVIGIVVGILVALIIAPIAALLLLPAILDFVSGELTGLNVAVLIGVGLLLGLLAALLYGVFLAFRSTAVTLAYRELSQTGKKREQVAGAAA